MLVTDYRYIEDILTEVRAIGYVFWVDGDRLHLEYQGADNPDSVKVLALVDTLKACKSEVLSYLAERPPMAVKVRSDILNGVIWVVAHDLPRAEWPADAPVYTREEVKILTQIGRDSSALVHPVKELFGARVVDRRRERVNTGMRPYQA
jgi:hypothetical protein